MVAEEVASLDALKQEEKRAAEQELAWSCVVEQTTADELLGHTIAAMLNASSPPTPESQDRNSPIPIQDFAAALEKARLWTSQQRTDIAPAVESEDDPNEAYELADADAIQGANWGADVDDIWRESDGEDGLIESDDYPDTYDVGFVNPKEPQQLQALDELEATLGACELSIQASAFLSAASPQFAI